MVDIVKDVQKAQAWLRENTDKAAQFEKRYGEGSALAVLNGTYQAPATPDAPTEFSFIAAQNGYKTIIVTKDMIIGIGKDGTFADKNNGQPYLALGEKIKANTQVIRKPKKTITKNTTTDNDDEQIIFDNFNAKWLNLTKDRASPNKFAVAARQIRNYLLNRGVTYTEAELKNEFSLITNGSEWKPSYGSITESQ